VGFKQLHKIPFNHQLGPRHSGKRHFGFRQIDRTADRFDVVGKRRHVRRSTNGAGADVKPRRRRLDARRFEIRRRRRRQRRNRSVNSLLGLEERSSSSCRFERSLASRQESGDVVSFSAGIRIRFVRLFGQVSDSIWRLFGQGLVPLLRSLDGFVEPTPRPFL